MHRSSRELSSRVSINVHRQPNRQRRLAWWLALTAGFGSLLWLSWQYWHRQHRIYQAGDVAMTHRMFENDCRRCHTESTDWAPLLRLLSFHDELPSTTDENCKTCHQSAGHQPQLQPALDEPHCAKCHQEHRGAIALARPNDKHCLGCHQDLESHGGKNPFANSITGFDVHRGHPEFLSIALVYGKPLAAIGAENREDQAVAKFRRPNGVNQNERWQDRGRIRFNHAKHLFARYNDQGVFLQGLKDENRDDVDLSNKCNVCHQPDADHRYFKPIQFEAHCCKCHPLLFDPVNFPGQTVPHEAPMIVRGFLTETYTLRQLLGATAPAADKPKQYCAAAPQPEKVAPNDVSDDDANQPRRPLPGHRDQQKLTQEQAENVLRDVEQAEQLALDYRQSQFRIEATGGCQYCHEVEPAEPLPESKLGDWKIVPTQIPSRWLPHGAFHHEPHRMLNCGVCHVGVEVSDDTGDVLIPSRDVCVACHSSEPKKWIPNWKTWFEEREVWVAGQKDKFANARGKQSPETASDIASPKPVPAEKANETPLFLDLLSNAVRGTRTDCIECHTYHSQAHYKWNGPVVPKKPRVSPEKSSPTPVPVEDAK